MTEQVAGAVWVANPTRAECIRFAEGGAILDRVQTSQPCYACALGGPDRTTLFLATVARGGEAAGSAIEGLIQARLLVAMDRGGGESIEVVHEALLSAWPRLVQWRQEDAESARLRDQLRVAGFWMSR